MFLEILQPQGDPFAEPQVMLMNYLVQSGVIRDVADKLDARLSVFKLILTNPDMHNQDEDSESVAESKAKIKTFLRRLLLLWSLLMKFCSDLFQQNYPASSLASLANRCIKEVDPLCKDKSMQIQYLKYLKKLLTQVDDSVSKAFMDSNHFINIVEKTNRKNNMISAQVRAIFEELKKLQCFKLHEQFVDAHKDTLERLKTSNVAVEALLNHNRRMRQSMRASSHVEDEKASEKQSEKKSIGDYFESNSMNSPMSNGDMNSPRLGEADQISIRQIENLFKKIKSNKASDDEDDKYSHDIFPGLGHRNNHFKSNKDEIFFTDKEEKSMHSDGEGAPKIEFFFELDKREEEEDNETHTELDDGHLPTKRISM